METTLSMPSPDDDGVEALRVLRAIRVHIKDGYELQVQLLEDLDEILAIVKGT
jgi:hypothetical protein